MHALHRLHDHQCSRPIYLAFPTSTFKQKQPTPLFQIQPKIKFYFTSNGPVINIMGMDEKNKFKMSNNISRPKSV